MLWSITIIICGFILTPTLSFLLLQLPATPPILTISAGTPLPIHPFTANPYLSHGTTSTPEKMYYKKKIINPGQYIYSVLHNHKTSQDKVGVKIKPLIIIVILHNKNLKDT